MAGFLVSSGLCVFVITALCCKLENLRIELAKELRMQLLNRGGRILFVNQKAEVDIRRAVGHHQNIDVRQAAESSARHTGRVFEVVPDQADQRCLRTDLNIAELPEIFDDRME